MVKDLLLLTAFRSNRIRQKADDGMDEVLMNESMAEPLQNLVGTLLILTWQTAQLEMMSPQMRSVSRMLTIS